MRATIDRDPAGGRTGGRARARSLGLGLAAAAAIALAASAQAARLDGGYVGVAAGAPGTVTLDVGHGMLMAFAGSTPRLRCSSSHAASAGPYRFRLVGPVHLRGNTFSFDATAPSGNSERVAIAVTGRLQSEDEITGTITAAVADNRASGSRCHAATTFETVAADRDVSGTSNGDAFGKGFTGANVERYLGRAGFGYAHHRITHLTAAVDITCPDHSHYSFLLDSAVRALDPIRVNGSGAFALSGLAPLAGHGFIVQYSLTGRIHGRHATGTLRAAVAILYPRVETCSSAQRWRAAAR
jgi:hypothetical protein